MANIKNLFLGLALLVLSEVHSQGVFDNSCLELFKLEDLNQACCKTGKVWVDEKSPEYEKCNNIKFDTEESLLAFTTCVVQESGRIKDGKMYHDKLQNNTTEAFVTELKRRCFRDKKQRTRLTKSTICPAMDLAACVYFNMAVICDEWDVSDNCKETVATTKKCKESLDRGSA